MAIELLPCQREAADRWVAMGGKGYCVSNVGSGKSFLACECIRRSIEKYPAPALYLSTKTALKEQEAAFAAYGLADKVTFGILEDLSGAKWEEIRRTPWGIICIDEADRMTGSASKRNRRLLTLRPRHRLMLTGTALRNGLRDVFVPLMWLKEPLPWRNWTDFSSTELRHDNPNVPAQVTGIRDEAKLASMMSSVMFTMVNPDSPAELAAEEVQVPLPPDNRAVYDRLMRESVLEAETGTLTMSNRAVCFLRGRQFVQMPEALGVNLSSPKEAALLGMLREYPGSSVVFTSFATVARILSERHGWPIIEGQTSAKQRQAVLDSKPEVTVMTSAGERGINLPELKYVHCLDRGFTDATMRQRAGRATRYGRKGEARLFLYVSPKTTDDKGEMRIVNRKLNEARKVYERSRADKENQGPR
jgi:superfamily II DNA or RNA helicase